MYWVDRDVSNEDKQQGSATERTTDLAGMNFYRTATKAEKAKTGKSILKYKPTQEEFNMAKITGISSPGKSKKIWKNLWV